MLLQLAAQAADVYTMLIEKSVYVTQKRPDNPVILPAWKL